MKKAIATITGVGPINLSKMIDEEEFPKKKGEKPGDYDKRTWREKAHYDEDGMVYLPGIMFKRSLDFIASQLGEKIQGRGLKQWATIFKSGISCPNKLSLKIHKDELQCERIVCDSTGKKGSPRVYRLFPLITPPWGGDLEFWIYDDNIDQDTFSRHLTAAGQMDGIGKWRVGSGGQYGQYMIDKLVWEDNAEFVRPKKVA